MSEKPQGSVRKESNSRPRRKRSNRGRPANSTDSDTDSQTGLNEKSQRRKPQLNSQPEIASSQPRDFAKPNQSSRRIKGPREFGSPAIPSEGEHLQPFAASELRPVKQKQRKNNRKAVKFDRTDEIIQYDALTPEPDGLEIHRFEEFDHQDKGLFSSFGVSEQREQELLSHSEPAEVPRPPQHMTSPLGLNRPLPTVPNTAWTPERQPAPAFDTSPLARSPWNDGGSSISLQADLDKHRLSLQERVGALIDSKDKSPMLPQSVSSFSVNEQLSERFDALPHRSLDTPSNTDGVFGAEISAIVANDADPDKQPGEALPADADAAAGNDSSDEYAEITELPSELVRKSSLREWQKRPETKHIALNPYSDYVAKPESGLDRTHSMKRRSIIDLLNHRSTLEGPITEEAEHEEAEHEEAKHEETSLDAIPIELLHNEITPILGESHQAETNESHHDPQTFGESVVESQFEIETLPELKLEPEAEILLETRAIPETQFLPVIEISSEKETWSEVDAAAEREAMPEAVLPHKAEFGVEDAEHGQIDTETGIQAAEPETQAAEPEIQAAEPEIQALAESESSFEHIKPQFGRSVDSLFELTDERPSEHQNEQPIEHQIEHFVAPVESAVEPVLEKSESQLMLSQPVESIDSHTVAPLTQSKEHSASDRSLYEAGHPSLGLSNAGSHETSDTFPSLMPTSSSVTELTEEAQEHPLDDDEYIRRKRDSTVTFDFSKPLDVSISQSSSEYSNSNKFVMPEYPLTSEPVLVPTLPLFNDLDSTTQLADQSESNTHFPVEVPVRPNASNLLFDNSETEAEHNDETSRLPGLLMAPNNLDSDSSSLRSVVSDLRSSTPVDIRQQSLFDFESAGNSDVRKSVLDLPAPDSLLDFSPTRSVRESTSVHSLRDLTESLGGSGSSRANPVTFSDSDSSLDIRQSEGADIGDMTTDTQRGNITAGASVYTASINEVDFVRMDSEQPEPILSEPSESSNASLDNNLIGSLVAKPQVSSYLINQTGSAMGRDHESLVLDSDLSDDEVIELEKGQNAAKALLAHETLQPLPQVNVLDNHSLVQGDAAPQISPMVPASPKADEFWSSRSRGSWAFAPRQTQSMDILRTSSPRAQPQFASPQLNSDSTFSPRVISSTATSWRSSSSNRGLSKTGSVLSSEQSTLSVHLDVGESISSIHEDLNRMIPEEDLDENAYPRAQYTVRKSASIIRASSPPRARGVVRAHSAEVKQLKQTTPEIITVLPTKDNGPPVTRSSSFIVAPRGSKIAPSMSQRARLNYSKLPEVNEAQEELQPPCDVPDARICNDSSSSDTQPKLVPDLSSFQITVDEQQVLTDKLNAPIRISSPDKSKNLDQSKNLGRRAPAYGLPGEKGRLFLAMDDILIPGLPAFVAENATMTLTLDNGIHCVTTPSRSLKEHIKWGEEFELSVCGDFSCIITLKLAWNDEDIINKYRSSNDAPQQPAPHHKRKSSLLTRLGVKHNSEQTRQHQTQQQPPVVANPLDSPAVKSWLSRVSGDGTFGRYVLHYSDFSQAALGRPLNILLTAGDRTSVSAPPQLKACLLFVPRVSSSESLPRTMSHAKHDLERAAQNPHPALAGQLIQIGGDCTQPRRREVVLDGGLLITHSASTGRPRVSINLTKCLDVIPLSKSNFDFLLQFRNGDELAFKVEFGPSRNQWISALMGVIGKPPSRAHWLSLVLHGNDKHFDNEGQKAAGGQSQNRSNTARLAEPGLTNEIDLPKRCDKIMA